MVIIIKYYGIKDIRFVVENFLRYKMKKIANENFTIRNYDYVRC